MTEATSTDRNNTTPSEFDRDTRLDPLGDGRFGATVPGRWSTGPGANGGLVAGLP